MRTNIEIDDRLMRAGMKATGKTTKRAAVEAALEHTVRHYAQEQALQKLWGIGWQGNLHDSRARKYLDWDHDRTLQKKSKRSAAA